MFTTNYSGHIEPLSIYLIRPNGDTLSCLDDYIDESSCSLSVGINEQYELNFDVVFDEDKIDNSWCDYIQEGMYLLVEKIGIFKMLQPEISLDGSKETKSITAHSCDVELEDKNCTVEINMGTKTSQEYLVQYEDDETESLLNPYTGIPYDWIVLYNTFPEQLQILLDKYDDGYYGEPDQEGKVVVTDREKIDELEKTFKTMPRLLNKLVEIGGEYTSIEYVTPEYEINPIGRNLILDSKQEKTGTEYVANYTQSEYGKSVLSDTTTSFTVSFDFETYGDYSDYTTTPYICVQVNEHQTNPSNLLYVTSPTRGRYVGTFKLTSAQATSTADTARVRLRYAPDGCSYKVWNFKIEEGAVATAWTPAPEDEEGTSEQIVASYTLNEIFRSRIVDLIDFYGKYRAQLSLLNIVLENTGGLWSVGNVFGLNDNDFSLANMKYQFEVDSTIYSFLTQSLAQTTKCVVNFDIYNRRVNVTPIEEIGDDTGIVLDYQSLLNTLKISSSEDRLATRLYIKGENDLGIEEVNFGQSYVDDISYKVNTLNGDVNVYVSPEFADKYNEYLEFREEKRLEYVELSRERRVLEEQISEIQYRVPNDDLSTDWGTFTREELDASLLSYKNLLTALESMYRYDYGEQGFNPDGTINENFIRNTIYWYDYIAYVNIIKEIECAIDVFPYYKDETKWTSAQIEAYKEQIKAWETEWSLYGTIELQAKIDAYTQNMSLLAESSVIKVSPDSDLIKTWNQLTDAEKKQFAYLEQKYYYSTYMDYYNNRQSAKTYLSQLQATLDSLKEDSEIVQSRRVEIANAVSVESYFTEDECKNIYQLYRDADYSNDNILITSIDSNDEKIDKMLELLEDGKTQASIVSRPQLTFNIDAENLLALIDYKPLWDSFLPGNYMYVQYRDKTYVKLRMVSYSFNPRLPTGDRFSITFSNVIRSNVDVNDIESVLGLSGAGVSGRSGSSGGGSGGTYGQSDDIDITISNTMLARLLNSQLFNKQVTDIVTSTVDVNSLNAKAATNTEVSDVRDIAESAVQSVTILFAKSNSNTTPPVSGWSEDAPVVSKGEYIWQKTITEYGTGEVESDTVCMTGSDGENALTVIVDSSAGIIFKRKGINTILTATVYYGTQDVTDDVTAFHWIKRDKDGQIDPDWSRVGAGRSIILTPQDVTNKAIFVCEVDYTP